MIKKRTYNTLFMLSSVDGKISTGNNNVRDFDKDLPKIKEVKEGLFQYYALERKTDMHSFNTGKVLAKIGINRPQKINKLAVNFIIVDNTHLNVVGISNLIEKSKKLYFVTSNKDHPAFKSKAANLKIIYYKNKINFKHLFGILRTQYNIKKVTIQSGGTINSILLREGLLDKLSIVVAPCLIGGKNTPTLIDGNSLKTKSDLTMIKTVKLLKIKQLTNSYLNYTYKIIS